MEGRKNPLIFKKNMAAQLRFATLHLKNPQDSCEGRCLVIMQSFGVVMHSTVFGKKQTQHISTTTSYKLSNTVETWWWWWSQDCHLAVTGLTMNSWLYKSILGSDVRPSVWELKLRWTWVMKLDDDPKQARKSPTEWLKKKRKEWSICNGQTSCTTMWETDKVIKKRWFCKLLNHCVYVVFHRNASLFWLGFC